ncbi:hypothetical protein cypCar_00033168, partial [Cyprinus carpio]
MEVQSHLSTSTTTENMTATTMKT